MDPGASGSGVASGNGLTTAVSSPSPSDRLMQTFRMPRELVTFLKAEAARGNRDLTGHVVRWLDGIRTYFGLPEAATALLETDRKLLGMERFEYLLHMLYQRSLELREKGGGFDAPRVEPPKRVEPGSPSGSAGGSTGARPLERQHSA
jgi:hypothetical protein